MANHQPTLKQARLSLAVALALSAGAVYATVHTISNSNFTMLSGTGGLVGGATDVNGSFDDSKICYSTSCTKYAMTLQSAQPFFGFNWTAHNIRVFGPGTYTFNDLPGQTAPLNLTVKPGELGAEMLFDWSVNQNIGVAVEWKLNSPFGYSNFFNTGSSTTSNTLWNLASTDGDGTGWPGIQMVNGPFGGFSANFNLNMSPPFGYATTNLTVNQGGTAYQVAQGGGAVTVSTDLANSSAYTFDWSGSDKALVAAASATNGATFTFDPSKLPVGAYTASVTATNSSTGAKVNGQVLLGVIAGNTPTQDSDSNGIPDSLYTPTNPQTLAVAVNKSSAGSLISGTGTLGLGVVASRIGLNTGTWGAGVTANDIGVKDSAAATTCVGGCFDFKVSGLTPGATAKVTVPLSAAIPDNAVYRKLHNGSWIDFDTSGGNAIASAAQFSPGVCPAPGNSAYKPGLNAGDFCIQLTLVDGGANDADGAANGIITDPGGVATLTATTPASLSQPDTRLGSGGCSINPQAGPANGGAWLMVGAFIGGLGVARRKRRAGKERSTR